MLLRTWTSRVATICAAGALVVGIANPAQASDSVLSLTKDGVQVGYMKHYDSDPDSFAVCDSHADGKGVTGKLWIWAANQVNDWILVGSQDDGGDAGCDHFNFNITEGNTYMWGIERHGGGPTKTAYLYE